MGYWTRITRIGRFAMDMVLTNVEDFPDVEAKVDFTLAEGAEKFKTMLGKHDSAGKALAMMGLNMRKIEDSLEDAEDEVAALMDDQKAALARGDTREAQRLDIDIAEGAEDIASLRSDKAELEGLLGDSNQLYEGSEDAVLGFKRQLKRERNRGSAMVLRDAVADNMLAMSEFIRDVNGLIPNDRENYMERIDNQTRESLAAAQASVRTTTLLMGERSRGANSPRRISRDARAIIAEVGGSKGYTPAALPAPSDDAVKATTV